MSNMKYPEFDNGNHISVEFQAHDLLGISDAFANLSAMFTQQRKRLKQPPVISYAEEGTIRFDFYLEKIK